MVQCLSMCLRPATPRSLTEPVSFGFIDPSKRISRAELDRLDKLWREKQQRNGTYIQATIGGVMSEKSRDAPRSSFESDMTRVEGRVFPQRSTNNGRIQMTEAQIDRNQNNRLWPFSRKQSQQQSQVSQAV